MYLPWILTNDSSAGGLALFTKIYTAFFGPIFAVLITDFFILHRRKFSEAALKDLIWIPREITPE